MLLGYHCRKVLIFDYTAVGPGQTPLPGGESLTVATHAHSVFSDALPADFTTLGLASLANGMLHVTFLLEPMDDVSGALATETIPDTTRPFTHYGAPLSTADRLFSLDATATAFDDLLAGIDGLTQTLFAKVEGLWPTAQIDDESFFPRIENGGALWLFDSRHWGKTDAKFLSAQKPIRNLLRRFSPKNADTTQFLLEQVFDIRLSKRRFFPQDRNDTIASAASKRRNPSQLSSRKKPNLAYYHHISTRVTMPNPGDPGLADVLANRVIDVESYFFHVNKLADRRGKAHVLSYPEWSKLGSAETGWLDTILAVAWAGMIALPDIVIPRPEPQPFSLKVRHKQQNEAAQRVFEIWELTVHGVPALRFERVFPAGDSSAFVPIEGRVAFEYKSGTPQSPTTLRVVAGRGIKITTLTHPQPKQPKGKHFQPHFTAYFNDYNKSHPWNLEIFRVQNNAWIPPLGAEILPERFLSPSRMNPSLAKHVSDLHTPEDPNLDYSEPLIDTTLPIRIRNTDIASGDEADLAVLITPTPWGEKISFPISEVIPGPSTSNDDEIPSQVGDKTLHQGTISVGASWRFEVDPFSGGAGYTYDLFLEDYLVNGSRVLMLHVVGLVTEDTANDVEVRTTLEPDRTYGEAAWNYLTNPNDNPQPNRTNVFSLDDVQIFLDASAEFWKTPAANIDYLPAPLQVRLPITEPAESDAGRYIINGNYSALDRQCRLGQTTFRFPTPGNDYAPTIIGEQSMSVRKLQRHEWHEYAVDDLLFLLIDLSLGMVPIVGDVADLVEFTYAFLSGRDRWGRPVTNFDLYLMAVGVAIPLISSTALRSGGDFVDAIDDIPLELSPRSTTSASPPEVPGFLTRILPLLSNANPGTPADKAALMVEAESFLDLTNMYKRANNSGPAHKTRVKNFVEDMVANAALIRTRIEGLSEGAGNNFFSIGDISKIGPDGKPGFIFRFLDEDYKRAASEYASNHGNAILDVELYLQKYARYSAKAFGRAVVGDSAMGIRTKSAIVRCPTFTARVVRTSPAGVPDKALDAITKQELLVAVVKYLNEAADTTTGTPVKMWGALYGRVQAEYLGNVSEIAKQAGFPLPDGGGVDTTHALIKRLEQLIDNADNAPAFLRELLVGGRVGVKSLPEDEIGTRVGEALIMAIDQLKHFEGAEELTDITKPLSNVNGMDLVKPLRKFIGDWVNGAGGVYEHAVKGELRVSAQISKAKSIVNANGATNLPELNIATIEVVTQARLVSRNGLENQLGSDELVFITIAGVTRVFDWQVKSSSNLARVSGYVLGDFLGTSRPRLIVDEIDGIKVYDIVGGSEIARQIAKQRLRKAHHKGRHPNAAVAGDPPLPAVIDEATQTVLAGHRHVYTIDSEQLIDTLIDEILVKLPDPRNVTAANLRKLSPDQRYVLEKIYKENPGDAWPSGVNLEDGTTFYEKFIEKRSEISQDIGNWIEGFEDDIPGFREALANLSDSQLDPTINEQFWIRWSNDDDVLNAMHWQALEITEGLD